MLDPELTFRRLTSGDPTLLTTHSHTLEDVVVALRKASRAVADTRAIPVWTGDGAVAFGDRASTLQQGVARTKVVADVLRGALEAAASAQQACIDDATAWIRCWRNRPGGMPAVVDAIWAAVIDGGLVAVGRHYGTQLAAIRGVLLGEEVSCDVLDEEIEEWVTEGTRKNQEWLKSSGSELGPIIPNTAAVGDGRGWVPQGLGYDPETRTLVQTYYKTVDGKEVAYVALIDEVTGREIGEYELGAHPTGSTRPEHAGGVSVHDGIVYVVDQGQICAYSLDGMRQSQSGAVLPQVVPPQDQDVKGGSYSAIHDGVLYMGTFTKDPDGEGTLYRYRRVDGQWERFGEAIATPPQAQGLVVHGDQLVFSTSYGRHQDHSSLVVQNPDGSREGPYDLPSMSEGAVLVGNEVFVTYESGAGSYSTATPNDRSWWWGFDDQAGLWANPYLTRTPLSLLGITGEVAMVPSSLNRAAGELEPVAARLGALRSQVRAVHVTAGDLGDVPAAASTASAVDKMLTDIARSLRIGSSAVRLVAELLDVTAADHVRVDDHIRGEFGRARLD